MYGIVLYYTELRSTYVITVQERHRQTDRQTDGHTDGQMTYYGITALCVASRGKN